MPGATLGVYDYLSGCEWHFNGDRWFHAASVIKVPVMVALFEAVDQGQYALNSRLLVRNRFLSAAGGEPFRAIRASGPRDQGWDQIMFAPARCFGGGPWVS